VFPDLEEDAGNIVADSAFAANPMEKTMANAVKTAELDLM
jgi:hypothetical protein